MDARLIVPLLILTILFSYLFSFADDNILVLRPITVTATRISNGDSSRVTRSMDSDFSIRLNNSLIDSRTRGPYGIQDDISMRGAPFEQTLVLLNGARMNDPQTGHFNTDIPLTRLDIDRVDIAYGPSSAYYGSSAMGGAVNILAKPPQDKVGVAAEFETGQYDLYSGALSLNMPLKDLKNKFSFEMSSCSGYRAETEFDKLILNSNSNIAFENGYIDFLFGYLKKDFGADSFYSDMFDNEEEHTDTRLFKLDASLKKDDVKFNPVLYYRRHWDTFILDRNRRDWYKNIHTSYVYGGEFSMLMDSPLGGVSYGLDTAKEEIDSTSLGDHSRNRIAFFAEDKIDIEKLFIDLGARIDYYSAFGWQVNPNFGIGYFIYPDFKLRASAGRAFRAPSFTDLYYRSPANVGNADLKPERSWSFDVGADTKFQDAMQGSITYFLRFSDNVIDWTRKGGSNVWYAENIGEFDVYGFEVIFKFEPHKLIDTPNLKKIEIKYGYTEDFKKINVTSKYVLNYLMHNFNVECEYETLFGVMEVWELSLKKRAGDSHYILLNTEFYKDLDINKFRGRIYLRAENIFDTDYTENGSVPMPGIWITAGLKIEF